MSTTLFSNQSWHWHPTMYLSCSYTASRRGNSDIVDYSFDFYNAMGSRWLLWGI